MPTPESKVKKKVREILEKREPSYFFMPAMNGYGSSGVPDFVACIEGRFYGIECKADGNKPTRLQLKNLQQIVDAGGHAFVVDYESLGVFSMMLDETISGRSNVRGVFDFTKTKE
jgi:Holliday junction resolvase